MPPLFRWTAYLLLLSACPGSLAAQGPLESALLADAQDGRLDQFDLPSACLIACGATEQAELARHRRALESLQPPLAAGTAEQQARDIFAWMRAEVLVGQYDLKATDLRSTLARGDYNCLSAVVLYVELCRKAGVPVEIWSRPGHVFCRLLASGLRIEPTGRQWQAASQSRAGSAHERRISPVELLGKVYYNRGVHLLAAEHFEPGIAALQIACQLDPQDAEARANLLAGLNNWALALAEQGQTTSAAHLIARGLAIDPEFPELKANQLYLQAAPR